ncbi:MAG: Fic family protein [bacterium]|nr:Fic family protein [bacterium]
MRTYQESHPWISFSASDLNDLLPATWIGLGEARAMCRQLAEAPLPPDTAQQLYQVALVKGVQGTTAIEGNTLTEEQISGILQGTYTAPPSRAYQEREVRNVIDALNLIADQLVGGQELRITPVLICEFNRQILVNTEYEEDAVPGEVRRHSVGVGRYRGAPAEDCDYLLGRLADWLESDTFESEDPVIAFALAIARAVCAHLYIAWIHPFGDGNGRTARLLEFVLLARTGLVPLPAAHVLSNHYNLTRDQYQRELARAGRTKSITGFVVYAAQGLIDGLYEQTELVTEHQKRITWINHVHETINRFPKGSIRTRQLALALALPSGQVVTQAALPGLTPEVAAAYAKVGPRTLSRDLNRLAEAELMVRAGGGWRSNEEILKAPSIPASDHQA